MIEIRDAVGKRVRLRDTSGRVHGEGFCYAGSDEPQIGIKTDDGTDITWLARLTELVDDND